MAFDWTEEEAEQVCCDCEAYITFEDYMADGTCDDCWANNEDKGEEKK